MSLIYVKDIDKSLLFQGFTIKASLLDSFLGTFGKLEIGETRQISVLLNGKLYSGIKVINQKFDRNKYPYHPEMYQVRYDTQHEFINAIRAEFPDIYGFIQEQMRIKNLMKKRGETLPNIKVPQEMRASLSFYASEDPNIWEAVPVTHYDFQIAQRQLELSAMDENTFEDLLLTDADAAISEEPRFVKIRKLDRNVCQSLKRLYGYRCQICGQLVSRPYGDNPVIDAHHIDPFVKSLNNNFNNIMILCPNHHRVIHTYNPTFKVQTKTLYYPNGYKESLLLNKHL